MGLFSGVGSAVRIVADMFDPNGKRDMSNPQYWADFGGTLSLAGVNVTERRVSQLGAVQAVRFGLAGAMSSLPVMVYKRGKNGARKEMPKHPLTALLARPNGWNTQAEFFGEIAWHLSYWRNAYCVIHPGTDYAIGSLEILHPRRLARIWRGLDGHVYYTFNPPATIAQPSTLLAVTYRDDSIWHLRANPLSEDGLLGVPIWETSRDVFGRAIAVHEYGDVWFQNSGQSGGTLEHPGNFKDKADEKSFLESWREAGTGRNRHKDRLLKFGVKYNPIKVTNAEAQLLETEKSADVDIFGLWSFPPHRAARLDRATNNNIEQQSLDFVIYSLAPLAIALEQGAERDLLLENDDGRLFVEFNFNALLRGDLRSRYAAYLIGRQGEWLSANDVLRFENMNPRTDPDGDTYVNPITKTAPTSVGGEDDPAQQNSGNKPGNGNKDKTDGGNGNEKP
jgi:HK97 family phage portal protein